MTGRVHRQPQKKPVLSIHLLGNETADVLVADMAEGKQDMLKAFLSKKAGQGEYLFLIDIVCMTDIFFRTIQLTFRQRWRYSGRGGRKCYRCKCQAIPFATCRNRPIDFCTIDESAQAEGEASVERHIRPCAVHL